MYRVITADTLHAMFSRETGNGPILLLSIMPGPLYPGGPIPAGAEPLLVTSDIPPGWGDGTNPPGTISRGSTFLPYPFRLALLNNDPQAPPQSKVEIDNVDRSILAKLQQYSPNPIRMKVELVTFLHPDIVDWTNGWLTMREVKATDLVVQGTLKINELLSEPSLGLITPSTDPGTFLIQ